MCEGLRVFLYGSLKKKMPIGRVGGVERFDSY